MIGIDYGAAASAVVDSLALVMTAWVVVVGGVGAALGSQSGRPWTGFAISVLVPFPIVNWLLVIALDSRGNPRRRRDSTDDVFQGLLDD